MPVRDGGTTDMWSWLLNELFLAKDDCGHR